MFWPTDNGSDDAVAVRSGRSRRQSPLTPWVKEKNRLGIASVERRYRVGIFRTPPDIKALRENQCDIQSLHALRTFQRRCRNFPVLAIKDLMLLRDKASFADFTS